jgi:hypothetical protein
MATEVWGDQILFTVATQGTFYFRDGGLLLQLLQVSF